MINLVEKIHGGCEMYKLIACDVDETLLSLDNTVSKRNIEAIQKATELGVKFVLATGRGFPTVQETLKDIGLYDRKDHFVISFNGGAVTENKDNKILHYCGIDFDFASQMYSRGTEYDVCIHVYTLDKVYVYNYVEEERAHLETKMDVIEVFDKNLEFLRDEEIVKILYMNTDLDYLRKIEKEVAPYTENCDVSYSSNRYLEFNAKGANKGEGLAFLASHLGMNLSETIAIGDNHNDLPMLEVAGLSVGVQNMVPELKSKVNYLSKANHEEDAIHEVIEKFILKAK